MKTPSELLEVVQLRRFVPSAFKIGQAYMIFDNEKTIFSQYPAIYLGLSSLSNRMDFFAVAQKGTEIGPDHVLIDINATDRFTIVPMRISEENDDNEIVC
jgi:hypothetical protein